MEKIPVELLDFALWKSWVFVCTSAAGERSLSSARRLKTSLRSKMRDERFSNLAVLPNGHKRRTDSVSIAEVAQEFVSRNEDLKRNFSIADNFKKSQS